MPTDLSVPILIADDDPDDCVLVKDAFDECQILSPLYFVHDGEDLMAYLTRRPPFTDSRSHPMPGLILLDLNMPRKDGREVLSEIRANEHLRGIPIVVMTTSSDSEDIVTSYQAGANSFITKPSGYSSLLEVVRHLGQYWLDIVELPERVRSHD